MASLRLIAGTEVTRAGKEVFTGFTIKQAAKASAGTSKRDLEELARKVINNHVVDDAGTTVRMLLDEHNKTLDRIGSHKAKPNDAKRLMEISTILRRLGLQSAFSDEDDEVDVWSYGNVFDPKTLIERIPFLHVCQSVLFRLTF
ncbi:hypothetical protein [Novimethylophilus kurashikiensis]|uniref:hypothetical protein n=1 Tax=Novimethylophilus kurashikiensis TaxID=1825523 RepID=UPI0011B264E9|nr:hypothetical protein [Novimethylophilus kurashikiensis]